MLSALKGDNEAAGGLCHSDRRFSRTDNLSNLNRENWLQGDIKNSSLNQAPSLDNLIITNKAQRSSINRNQVHDERAILQEENFMVPEEIVIAQQAIDVID